MSARRSGAGVGVLDGILYAVGGHDGPLVRKSVEAFNPETNQWTPVSDMALCRRNAGKLLLLDMFDFCNCCKSNMNTTNRCRGIERTFVRCGWRRRFFQFSIGRSVFSKNRYLDHLADLHGSRT